MADESTMNRRGFFKRSLGKVAAVTTDFVEHKVASKAKNWIRPPFAKPELDFLIACSRCGNCIEACPYKVIFPLPLKRGAEVAATPAMDIPNKACHLCTQWHCVNACKDNALTFDLINNINSEHVDTEQIAIESIVVEDTLPKSEDCPPMAIATINTKICMPHYGPECGACRGSCPVPNTLVWHNEKPTIVQENCIGCALCIEHCISDPKAIDITTLPIIAEIQEQPIKVSKEIK